MRLDLEAAAARRAVEMGIKIAVNTDAHHIEELDLMHYGITTARKGWVEAKSVLNTMSLEDFIAWTKGRGR
jgi:DNA polymerase (family 10)